MVYSSPLLSAPNECESLKFKPPMRAPFFSREENWSKGTTARATAVGRLEFDHNRPNNACILRWTSGNYCLPFGSGFLKRLAGQLKRPD
jgi:hypothetical protein